MTTYHSTSAEQTLEIGRGIGERLSAGSILLLIGPLGAGKTVLAKGIARGIGIRDEIISPTYTIISDYSGGRFPFAHIDLYRIEGREQMENIGIEDVLRGDGVVLIEWGEKLDTAFAPDAMRVSINLTPDGGRDILVDGGAR